MNTFSPALLRNWGYWDGRSDLNGGKPSRQPTFQGRLGSDEAAYFEGYEAGYHRRAHPNLSEYGVDTERERAENGERL